MPPNNIPDRSSDNPLKKIPKPVLIVGGVAGAALLYVWNRNRQNANSGAGVASANPYGAPEAGTGVLNPIIITQPNNPGTDNGSTTTTGTTPTGTTTTTPTSSTPPAATVTAASLGLSNDAFNFMIHQPAPGYTGLSWSKLNPAEKANVYEHLPVSYLNASGSKVQAGQNQTLAEIVNEVAHRPGVTAASTPQPITSKTVG